MEEKNTYFLSDLHLGAAYMPMSREREKKIVSFLDSIKEKAEAIYLLGDILDYWYEYRYVVPRGFVRFFGKLAELSDSGIRIVWLIGNHDIWIFDYLPAELGIEVVDGYMVEELFGKKVFLSHGDGVGKKSLTFSFIRSIFRNKLCQRLYSALHPRWTIPFAHRWSSHSRKADYSEKMAEESMLATLKDFVIENHALHPEIELYIFGHLHILVREQVAPKCEIIVLGEWIKTFSYAKMSAEGITLHKWKG